MRFLRYIAGMTAAVIFISLLGGCWSNRSFSYITPHLEQQTVVNYDKDQTINSYSALKAVILHIIENTEESGAFRITDYAGDVEADVREACREIQTGTPLGVYAVDYMSYECMRILTYYEVSVNITYRSNAKKFKEMKVVENSRTFESVLQDMYNNFENKTTLWVPYYYESQYDVENIMDKLFYDDPFSAVSYPGCHKNVYPDGDDSGFERIIEVELDWGVNPERLANYREKLLNRAESVLPAVTGDQEKDAEAIALKLREIATYLSNLDNDLSQSYSSDQRAAEYTAYGALVNGVASSKGIAMAYLGLCKLAGLDCQLIFGRLNGVGHVWNLVRIDNKWYHIDATSFSVPRNDNEVSRVYKWGGGYPLCDGESLLKSTSVSEPIALPSMSAEYGRPMLTSIQ